MNASWTARENNDFLMGCYAPSLRPVRWRDPSSGQFISFDSFEGSPSDPTHLHKYLYAGADPIDNSDPSGNDFTTADTAVADGAVSPLMSATTVAPVASGSSTGIILLASVLGGANLAALYGVYALGGSPMDVPSGVSIGDVELANQLQQNPVASAQGLQQAENAATASGQYTTQQAAAMPKFYVFKTGLLATPEIWENDDQAMKGVGTKGGAAAPDVLDYQRGINKDNRGDMEDYAKSIGMMPTATQSRDEYPFASTKQGGDTPWLRVALVPVAEQDIQMKELRQFYATNTNSSWTSFTFLVVLVP